MDRLEAMELLLAVLDEGSMSAAGRARRIPVSTVSRTLSELEERLGTRLMVRTTRKLSLTDAGQAYVEAARRILDQVEEAEREAAGEFSVPKGQLTITAPLCFGRLHVLPVVAEFLALFPEIDVRMLLSDRNIHLVDEHIDMATRIGQLPDSSLVATRIGMMRTVVCGSPAFLNRHRRPRHPHDLLGMPSVIFDTPQPSPGWQLRDPDTGLALEVPMKPRLAVTAADTAVEAASAGVGLVRLLQYQVADAVRDGKLEVLLEKFEPEPAPVHIIHVARGQMPLKLRSFIDFAAPRLRARLDRLSER